MVGSKVVHTLQTMEDGLVGMVDCFLLLIEEDEGIAQIQVDFRQHSHTASLLLLSHPRSHESCLLQVRGAHLHVSTFVEHISQPIEGFIEQLWELIFLRTTHGQNAQTLIEHFLTRLSLGDLSVVEFRGYLVGKLAVVNEGLVADEEGVGFVEVPDLHLQLFQLLDFSPGLRAVGIEIGVCSFRFGSGILVECWSSLLLLVLLVLLEHLFDFGISLALAGFYIRKLFLNLLTDLVRVAVNLVRVVIVVEEFICDFLDHLNFKLY